MVTDRQESKGYCPDELCHGDRRHHLEQRPGGCGRIFKTQQNMLWRAHRGKGGFASFFCFFAIRCRMFLKDCERSWMESFGFFFGWGGADGRFSVLARVFSAALNNDQ